MEQTITGQAQVLHFNTLTIAQASNNLNQISVALEVTDTLLLDLSACEDVDTAGLQLLAAIRLDPMFQNRVNWTGCTAEFLVKAERLGLSDLLAPGKRGSDEH